MHTKKHNFALEDGRCVHRQVTLSIRTQLTSYLFFNVIPVTYKSITEERFCASSGCSESVCVPSFSPGPPSQNTGPLGGRQRFECLHLQAGKQGEMDRVAFQQCVDVMKCCGGDQGIVGAGGDVFGNAATMRAWVRLTGSYKSSTGIKVNKCSTKALRCARRSGVLARSTPTSSSLAVTSPQVSAHQRPRRCPVQRLLGKLGP